MTNARVKRALIAVPSVTDVVGAGGVAPRWRGYTRELEASGWVVDLWTVDAADAGQRIPRCVHPFFPKTLTDARAPRPRARDSRRESRPPQAPSPTWMWALWRRFAQFRPDVMVVTDLFNDVNLALLCRAARVPLVYSLHTDGSKLPGGVPAAASLSQAITAALSARCATTSESFARVLAERGVVPSAAALAHYRPVPAADLAKCAAALDDATVRAERRRLAGSGDRALLGYVGRWSAEKRMRLLVACARKCDDFTLVIVGDAADEAIARDVEAWHDPPRVVVRRGMRQRGPELAATYRALDFLVSASDFETFGNTCAEAAVCGTPALVQDGPGFVDQVGSSAAHGDAPPGVFASDRGALLDFGSPDAADLLSRARAHCAPLVADPKRVIDAAAAAAERGATIAGLLDAAARPWDARPPAPRWKVAAWFLASLILAASLRLFVSSYAAYLNVALAASRAVEACAPTARRWLRPPARRVRWAGSLRLDTCLRTSMDSVKRGIRRVRAPQLNLVPDNPFDDYHLEPIVKLEGLRETAAALALPKRQAAKFAKKK